MTARCRKEKLWFLDSLATIHVGRDDTRGLTVVEQCVPQNVSPPLHVHRGEDVIFHMLAGEARFVVDGEDMRVHPGDTVMVRRGTPYTYLVTSAEGARWLSLTNGGAFERMLRTVSRRAERDALPPPAGHPTPSQISSLETACRENQIEFVGLSLSAVPATERANA
jgi:quercetin dioxygenase-like cupin family protein